MADFFWGAFVVLVIVLGSIVGANTILKFIDSTKECTVNSECSSGAYCGSDFKCHEFPRYSQERTWGYITAAAILGVSCIIASLIYSRRPKYDDFFKKYSEWYWSQQYNTYAQRKNH